MKADASAVLRILALGLACGLPSTSAVPAASPLPEYEGLIRVQNGRFVDDNCQEFPVTGTNTLGPSCQHHFHYTLHPHCR